MINIFQAVSLSRVLTFFLSIATLIKASDYACTDRDRVQASAMFLNKIESQFLSLSLPHTYNLYFSFISAHYLFYSIIFLYAAPITLALGMSEFNPNHMGGGAN